MELLQTTLYNWRCLKMFKIHKLHLSCTLILKWNCQKEVSKEFKCCNLCIPFGGRGETWLENNENLFWDSFGRLRINEKLKISRTDVYKLHKKSLNFFQSIRLDQRNPMRPLHIKKFKLFPSAVQITMKKRSTQKMLLNSLAVWRVEKKKLNPSHWKSSLHNSDFTFPSWKPNTVVKYLLSLCNLVTWK